MMNIELYEKYIDTIENYIQKCFEAQKPYVFCKAGCSTCCETGIFPISKLEFEYMKIGMGTLASDTLKEIQDNVEAARKRQEEPENTEKFYKCPFLVDKKCSIYKHRGLLCHSYGLLIFNEKRITSPCCTRWGLNYSSVYDLERGTISGEMYEKSGIETEPLSFNLSFESLINNNHTAGLDFGECRALIEWFED